MLLLVALAQAIECEAPRSIGDVEATLSAAEQAVAELDERAVQQQVATLTGLVLPCMRERLDRPTAARTHRLMALHFSLLGETPAAEASLATAWSLDPGHTWAPELLPADHPLLAAWSAGPDADTRKIPEPRDGSFAFDGQSGRLRPAGAPTIAQRLDASGTPTWTGYLGARDPLPSYAAVPRKRNALIACSAGAAGASAGAWAWSLGTRWGLPGAALDPDRTAKQLDGQRALANGLQLASLGLLGAGVGCGVGAVLVGPR